MAIQFAKKGTRPGEAKISISKNTKNAIFSAGFFRKYNLNKENPIYVREGYDIEARKIAFEFCSKDDKSGELLKLNYSASGSSASCKVSPILHTFNLNIDDISGNYKSDAIDVTILGKDNKQIFLLDVNRRDAH